ncbi:signal transduction histidine kinase [Streptosporangium saharense]|uniref:histidine kinase n=2 Tax=Streptosporangium saharense TaxID=1706840 RepID=A0A7W7QMN7_9ACTN|nr:HAMP domain-containing sensor histidine kinase [Streptosporangium saharense]MBB4916434.1 signal transduction histidine kinase [Streptosporangium saharense]
MSGGEGAGEGRFAGGPADEAGQGVPTHPMISPHSERGRQATVSPVRLQAPPPTGPPAWDGPPPPGGTSLSPTPLERLHSTVSRISIRWRLTITYGVLFFIAGVLLLFVIYMMVGWAIESAWPTAVTDDMPSDVAAQIQQWWNSNLHLAVTGARKALLTRSVPALAGVGILAIIIGYLAADRALRPIQQMTTTARRLSDSTLAHERIGLEGPDDELKELADTFDAMLTRLNVAFDTQRRFVANASHELRTPLTINRTVLEIALGDPQASEDLKALGRTLLEVNARNERLIEGLLLLARSERELSVRKPVDVKDVAETAVEQLLPRAKEAGVVVTTELRGAETVGDPVLLERCVSNLVENAIKHNLPDRGRVWVRTGMVEGALVVQVANTGPHVPAYEVNSLFEPFRRLNAERVDSSKGAGLGLSIVRAVVRAHGGNVAAVPRDGGGLVVTVRLQSR